MEKKWNFKKIEKYRVIGLDDHIECLLRSWEFNRTNHQFPTDKCHINFFFHLISFEKQEFVCTMSLSSFFIARGNIKLSIKWFLIYMEKLFIDPLLTSFWFDRFQMIIFVTFLTLKKIRTYNNSANKKHSAQLNECLSKTVWTNHYIELDWSTKFTFSLPSMYWYDLNINFRIICSMHTDQR